MVPRHWTIGSLLALGGFVRLLLIAYARVHDYLFEVAFTDIDYRVFTDAARHVRQGGSPYDRATYRYTPFLAYLLLPNLSLPEFGKALFCALDLLVGWFCYMELGGRSNRNLAVIAFIWLFNPLTMIVSARGNADVLVSAAVLGTLYLLHRDKWLTAAFIHGLLAIHLKIYPVIYLPSIFLHLARLNLNGKDNWRETGWKLVTNRRGMIFGIVSIASFSATVFFGYRYWGGQFLNEFLLYHISRTDTRHNFSPYFYLLYLTGDSNAELSRILGLVAFLPQATLVVIFACRYYRDLPFCWFITTMAFVSFNKVCTSQYFIWYICLLPIAQKNIQIPLKRVAILLALWSSAQGFWLLFAYLFEFRGWNTFLWIWLSSLWFLMVNCYIMGDLIRYHKWFGSVVVEKKLQ